MVKMLGRLFVITVGGAVTALAAGAPEASACVLLLSLVLFRIDSRVVIVLSIGLIGGIALSLASRTRGDVEEVAVYAYFLLAAGILGTVIETVRSSSERRPRSPAAGVPSPSRARHRGDTLHPFGARHYSDFEPSIERRQPRATEPGGHADLGDPYARLWQQRTRSPQSRPPSAFLVFVLAVIVLGAGVTAFYFLRVSGPSTSAPVRISGFEPTEPWIGGRLVRAPRRSGSGGLTVTSVNGRLASASLRVSQDVRLENLEGIAVSLWVYVNDVSSLDNKVYASRLELFPDRSRGDGYTIWLDSVTHNGWTHVVLPVLDLPRTGEPQLSHIALIRVWVYSKPAMHVAVTFDDLELVSLR